jgi:hypothetical protein
MGAEEGVAGGVGEDVGADDPKDALTEGTIWGGFADGVFDHRMEPFERSGG